MYESIRRWRVRAVLAVLVLLAALFVAPLVVAFQVALRGNGLSNFGTVLGQRALPRFFLNSAIIGVSTTLVATALTASAAYALSKLRLRGVGVMMLALVIGLMIPPAALLLPLFITVREMGLLDTHVAVVAPVVALLVPGLVLLTKAFMDGLPDEVLDAAALDGCTPWQVLWRIVIPLSRPMLVVVGFLSFITAWNEYLLSSVFLRDESSQVVTQAPQFFVRDEFTQNTPLIFCALIVVSVPTLLLFVFVRRFLLEAISAGAID